MSTLPYPNTHCFDVEGLRMVAWILRGDGSAAHTNAAFRAHTGLSDADSAGLGWLAALHTGDPEALPSHWRLAFERDAPFGAELRLGRDGGGHRWFRVSVVPLRDGSATWLAMAEPSRDEPPDDAGCLFASERSPRGALDRTHRESERRLGLALAGSGTGIWEWSIARGRCFWSPEACAIFGVPFEAADRPDEDLIRMVFPADLAALSGELDRLVQSGDELDTEFRVVRADGAVRWVHSRARLDRDATGRAHRLVGTVRDISRERELTERLAASEAAYRELANALPNIVWTTDASAQVDWLNDGWVALTGHSVAETLAEGLHHSLIHPDDHAVLWQRWVDGVAAGAPWESEYRLRSADGAYRWYMGRAVPVRDVAGRIVRWVGSATDIHDRRLAEDELRRSEQRWMALFHLSPLSATITRASDGRLMDVNAAFVQLFGLPREDAIGRTAVELGMVGGPARDGVIAKAMTRDGAEIVVCTSDGRALTMVLAVTEVDFEGERCLLGLATDVTSSRAAEAALRESEAAARARADELAAVMDAVPVGIWIARDPACRVLQGNRTGNELLRLPHGAGGGPAANESRPSGAAFEIFVEGERVAPDQLPLQVAARDGVGRRGFAEEFRFDDGQVVSLFGSAIPLLDEAGAPRGGILALMDVTRLKQAEAALREADRKKDQFLAMLSHELRNPLAPILTAAKMMALHGDVATPAERTVIVRQTEHMVRLVDDLLDVSRALLGKITLKERRLEIAHVVARAVEATHSLVDGRRHTLELAVATEGAVVRGDEVRLTQVVVNLIANAARYTPVGGHIHLSAAREGDEVVVRVRDDGVGLEPALVPQMFELFVQGERRAGQAEGGLGLGLALVRMLTALHGGSVEAESDGPGRGTELTVRLPAVDGIADSDVPVAPVPVAARDPVRRRVLVVDDNVDAARTLSKFLEWSGYDVRVVHDGSAALAEIDGFDLEVAILDIGLPDMDGYALASALRERFGVRSPVLVALTGYGQEGDERRSHEAGFVRHLVKPVDPDVLIALIDDLSEGHGPRP